MLEISVTSSTQRERNMTVTGTSTAYDNSEVTGKGNIKSSYVLVKQHTGVPAGTYTLKQILQQLINRSQTLEFTSGTKLTNCNCDCDCGDDGGSGS